MNIIGISGLARSGKDLFTSVAIDILKTEHNITAERHALAYELKNDLHDLVKLSECGRCHRLTVPLLRQEA